MNNSILIVEDDISITKFIQATLEANSYQCIMAYSGEEALNYTLTKPNLIILDLGLPDIDGIDIIKKIRLWSKCPIIVVSARWEYLEKIEALDAGADDYMTKPFNIDELMARIRVALRRNNNDITLNDPIFTNGNLKIDYNAGTVEVGNEEIHLTPIEYKVLILLSKNVGKVLTHRTILKEVWVNYLESDIPSLRVFVATLRKKLEIESVKEKYIETHIGVGYKMVKITNADNGE
ncbi:MAG: DNA-binding response regulator [Haloplasmataceae bacterium]|jgi:two-component system KDP operon response regulator KdpE|nr:DNA-binding response regulator [Haloplasmataceae bacterium]